MPAELGDVVPGVDETVIGPFQGLGGLHGAILDEQWLENLVYNFIFCKYFNNISTLTYQTLNKIETTAKNFASRNRRRQSAYRRRQVVEATLDCIDRLGISQTTLAAIAARAGLSQGNILFHFGSKEALLENTLRELNDEYNTNWRDAVEPHAGDPMAALRAQVEASFAPQVCNRRKISVWYAFWGESRSRPAYMRVCGESDRAFSAQLRESCAGIAAERGSRLPPDIAALSIEGTIDGLWQSYLIGPPGFKRRRAIAAVLELVDGIFPADDDT